MRSWRALVLLLGLGATTAANAESMPPASETVVLLHGMGLRSWAMWRVESALQHAGYRVLNLSYPSRSVSLETLGGEWLPARLRESGVAEASRLHFVTHSMGGVVVRVWLQARGAPPNLGRVMMLAPPNAGSEVVDHLKDFPPFRWMTGVNGLRLGTESDSAPRALGPWSREAGELGIIAGDRSLNPLFSSWLEGPDDGKVSVARAQLEGAADFLVLHHSHAWLQWRADTLAAVKTFLRAGQFPSAIDSPAASARVSFNR